MRCIYQADSDRPFLPSSLMLLYICLRHTVIGKSDLINMCSESFSDRVLQFIIGRGKHDVKVSWP